MHIQSDVPEFINVLAGRLGGYFPYRTLRGEGTSDWHFNITLDGKGSFRGSGPDDYFEVGPRTLILIRPGTPYNYGPEPLDAAWDRVWVHCYPKPDWHELLNWPQAPCGVMRLDIEDDSIWDEISGCALRIVDRANRSSLRNDAFAMNLLERILLLCDESRPEHSARLDPRINEIIVRLDQFLGADVTIQALAEHVHLSPSRLLHLFKDEVGVPLARYVNTRRLKRAKDLLERTTFPIAHIGESVGMDSPYFSTWFKTETGCSPRSYRNAHLSSSPFRIDSDGNPGPARRRNDSMSARPVDTPAGRRGSPTLASTDTAA
jgi:AraC family transcriptional regulator of arabinose operon